MFLSRGDRDLGGLSIGASEWQAEPLDDPDVPPAVVTVVGEGGSRILQMARVRQVWWAK